MTATLFIKSRVLGPVRNFVSKTRERSADGFGSERLQKAGSSVYRGRKRLTLVTSVGLVLFALIPLDSAQVIKLQIQGLVLVQLLWGVLTIRALSREDGTFGPWNLATVFIAAYWFFFLAMPIVWLISGINTAFPVTVMKQALLISGLGLVVWTAAYMWHPRSSVSHISRIISDEWDERRLFIAIAVLALPFVIGEYFGSFGVPLDGQISLIPLFLTGVTAIYLMRAKTGRIKWLILLLVIGLTAGLDPIFTERREAMKLAVVLGIGAYVYVRPYGLRFMAIAATVFFAFIIFQIALVRGANSVSDFFDLQTSILEKNASNQIGWYLQQSDFPTSYENFEYLLTTVPDDTPYLWGITYAKPLFWAVPRSTWPDKPQGIPYRLVRQPKPYTFAGGTAQGATMFGELLWNFGVVGIVVGMMMLGVISRWVEDAARGRFASMPIVVLYSIVLAMMLHQWRGAFAQILASFIIGWLAPFLVLDRIAGIRPGGMWSLWSGEAEKSPDPKPVNE